VLLDHDARNSCADIVARSTGKWMIDENRGVVIDLRVMGPQ
jgi:hypothetical protein